MSTDDIKTTVAIIVAVIALVGVMTTAIASLLVSRRSTYLNAVTVERSKWIDKLRTNIAKMISLAHLIDTKTYRDANYIDLKEFDQRLF